MAAAWGSLLRAAASAVLRLAVLCLISYFTVMLIACCCVNDDQCRFLAGHYTTAPAFRPPAGRDYGDDNDLSFRGFVFFATAKSNLLPATGWFQAAIAY